METEEVETEKEKTIWRIFAKKENEETKQQLLVIGGWRVKRTFCLALFVCWVLFKHAL